MTEWQPIETAPEIGPFIVCDITSPNRRGRAYLATLNRGGGWWKIGPNQNMQPTHWMPLPEPPQ